MMADPNLPSAESVRGILKPYMEGNSETERIEEAMREAIRRLGARFYLRHDSFDPCECEDCTEDARRTGEWLNRQIVLIHRESRRISSDQGVQE